MAPMSSAGRVSACDLQDARVRLVHAQKFVEVAEIAADESSLDGYGNVAATLAVLGGIAAADAACCAALQQRSRAKDHHDAEKLVAGVQPGGPEAARDLRRLLDLKDEAQYGVIHVGRSDLRAAIRCARRMVAFAEHTVRR